MIVLKCCKCNTEFEDTGKDYPSGVICPICKKKGYSLVGICHRYDTEKEEWISDVLPDMNGEGI